MCIHAHCESSCALLSAMGTESSRSYPVWGTPHLTSVPNPRFALGFLLHSEPFLGIRHLLAHLILAFPFQLTQICSITGVSLLLPPSLFSGSPEKTVHHLLQPLSLHSSVQTPLQHFKRLLSPPPSLPRVLLEPSFH